MVDGIKSLFACAAQAQENFCAELAAAERDLNDFISSAEPTAPLGRRRRSAPTAAGPSHGADCSARPTAQNVSDEVMERYHEELLAELHPTPRKDCYTAQHVSEELWFEELPTPEEPDVPVTQDEFEIQEPERKAARRRRPRGGSNREFYANKHGTPVAPRKNS